MGSRLTKSEYERVVVDTLRYYLIERGWEIRYEGKFGVEEVGLDASGAVHMVEMLFRDDARPECLFGWRYAATEADADAMEDIEHPTPWEEGLRGAEQAEIWAGTFVLTHFQEQIEALGYGLPPERDPDGVTWIGDY